MLWSSLPRVPLVTVPTAKGPRRLEEDPSLACLTLALLESRGPAELTSTPVRWSSMTSWARFGPPWNSLLPAYSQEEAGLSPRPPPRTGRGHTHSMASPSFREPQEEARSPGGRSGLGQRRLSSLFFRRQKPAQWVEAVVPRPRAVCTGRHRLSSSGTGISILRRGADLACSGATEHQPRPPARQSPLPPAKGAGLWV